MSETSHEQRGVLPEGAIVLSHGGETLWLLRERAAYWVERSTLLIADVHLGKAEAMQAHGVAVPACVGDESLTRISHAVKVTGAKRVIVLGDLLHAPVGVTAGLLERVSRWRGTLEADLCLVPGNHDAAAARVVGVWGIRLLEAVHEEGGLTLKHVPPPGLVERAHVAGHVHPALSVRTGRGPGKVACFHVCGGEACGGGSGGGNGGGTLVLPAFSRFTGGVSVRRVRGQRLFAVTDEGVVEA